MVYNEDCLTTIGRFADKEIDVVITSPPYNMNRRVHSGKYTKRTPSEKDLSTKYEFYSDDLLPDEYFEWQKTIIESLFRVTRKYIFYNIQPLTGNKLALFKLIGHFAENIKEIIVWDKITAEPAIGSGILNSQFEFIIVFSPTPQDAMVRTFIAPFQRGTISNVIKIGKERNNKYNHINSAKMPDKLADWLIYTFTEPNDLVYDPFCGVGTTLISAKRANRRFVGSDTVKECCDVTERELNLTYKPEIEYF